MPTGLLIAAILLAVLTALGALAVVALFLQNGRILTRLDALEVQAKFRWIPGETSRDRVRRLFQGFSVGNRFEFENIVESVAFRDEYGIGAQPLQPESVVIDIGAHIGVFSYLCHIQGSRSVHAYEPSERNFRILHRNTGSLPGVHLTRAAVWRSDTAPGQLMLSGPAGENTGSGTVLSSGRGFDCAQQQFLDMACSTVPTVAFDEVLARFPRVALVKLDCEGSEFPILLTSRQLHRVNRIVAEVHEFDAPAMALLPGESRVPGFDVYSVEILKNHLESAGFRVDTRPGAAHMHWIDARRS